MWFDQVSTKLSEAVSQGELAEAENSRVVASLRNEIEILTPSGAPARSAASIEADVMSALTEEPELEVALMLCCSCCCNHHFSKQMSYSKPGTIKYAIIRQ